MKLIYVGFKFAHHGEYSGYDQIKKYLKYDEEINIKVHNIKKLKINIFKKIIDYLLYKRYWVNELTLILKIIFDKNANIYHIIYGENIYKYIGIFKKRNIIIATFHQPPEYFKYRANIIFKKNIKYIDKIIVMSKDMETYFHSKYPNKKIKYIPHGIDTNYFKPFGEKDNDILMVGNWLRDFEFAAKVFKYLENENINILVVTNKENNKYFADNKNLILYNNITDNALLKLYQKTKIVFLPLIDYTANNALLEGLATGCDIIIATNCKKIESESPVKYVDLNLKRAIAIIKNTLHEWKTDNIIKNYNYVKEKYSWEKIADITKDFIEN